MMISGRKGKIIWISFRTGLRPPVAGPYSLRPKPGAPVSMPEDWPEVKNDIKPVDYNIRNAIPSLKKRGDIFKGVLNKGIDRENSLRKIQEIFQVKDPVK